MYRRSVSLSISVLCCLALIAGCSLSPGGGESSTNTTNSQVHLGFNVASQVRSDPHELPYLREKLDKLRLEGVNTSQLWLRPFGGTSSQRTFPQEWTDGQIGDWVQLQQDYGVKYVFTVNFNNLPAGELDFYQRWVKSGARFEFIELGNEQYLQKFLKSDYTKLGVTERTGAMTPQKYIAMSNEYIEAFRSVKASFYFQFAPIRSQYTSDWNRAMADAVNQETFKAPMAGAALHLYQGSQSEESVEQVDLTQIDTLRRMINRPIHMAITEFGILADSKITYQETARYQQFIAETKTYVQSMLGELQPDDSMFNQILYRPGNNLDPYIFHAHYNGITPLGEAVFHIYQDYWLSKSGEQENLKGKAG